MPEYSIVIPTYNESDKITASLTQVLNFMRGFAQTFEVLVVDDGSSDKTADIIENYRANNPEIKLIRNAHKGKGPAIWTGIMAAEGDYIYVADADFSAPISELKKLVVWIKDNNFDVVIASREAHGAKRIDEPLYRHLMGRIFNILVQIIALPGIKDTQCGFKLFKKDVAKQIFGKLKVYSDSAPIINKPFLGAFDVEVLYIARKLNFKIKEAAVTWTYVRTTRLRVFHTSIKMVRDVINVRINDFRGVYK
jgi:glycosyltransferase involved in cell wall biosynthesis